MTPGGRTAGRGRVAAWPLLLAALLAAGPVLADGAREQSASVRGEVAGGDTYTARLGNLPAGATLAIGLDSDAPVAVLLLGERDYRSFPLSGRHLFAGPAAARHRFSLQAPERGDYYLVIDNREGGSTRAFSLQVTASIDAAAASDRSGSLHRVEVQLDEFERSLRRLFVFEALEFRLQRCGTANSFVDADQVIICIELAQRLLQSTSNREQARNILLFAMLHEFGHVVLRQWGYPFHDNEELADEFATVLLLMLGQGERGQGLVGFFAGRSPDEELAIKRGRDDRHPLSVQRARNIARWLDDPGLVRRWQGLLVPHLQTEVLQMLAARPEDWTEPALVRSELAQRGER